MRPYADYLIEIPRCQRFSSRCCRRFRCRYSRRRSPRPAATTSTSRATWPSPSPSNNPQPHLSLGACVRPRPHPLHSDRNRLRRQSFVADPPRAGHGWCRAQDASVLTGRAGRGLGADDERGPRVRVWRTATGSFVGCPGQCRPWASPSSLAAFVAFNTMAFNSSPGSSLGPGGGAPSRTADIRPWISVRLTCPLNRCYMCRYFQEVAPARKKASTST